MALGTYFLIFLFIEILFYSFHLSVLTLMTAQRKTLFKGPFYNIFRIVLIADFLGFASMVIFQKGALIPIVLAYITSNNYLATGLLAFVNFVTVTQFFGHLFLALNRFTLIWIPLKHKNFWQRQWYTVVICGIPLINISWKLNKNAVFLPDPNSIVNLVYTDESFINLNNIISTTIFLSTTCLAAALNFLSFIKFFARKQNANASINVNERNLLFVSFIIFLAQLLRASYSANRLIFTPTSRIIIFYNTALPIINDLFAWSGSLSLMVLSSSTRKAYKHFYICKNDFQIQATNSTVPKLFTTITPRKLSTIT